MRFHERAPFTPILARPPLAWPNGARLAIWVVPNVEYFHDDSLYGATIATAAVEPPDVPNYAWRDYGARVGIWRIMRILDGLGIPGTVALNSEVCGAYPEVVQACVERGWELMGHGRTNSESLSGASEGDERALIATVLETIERQAGKRPVGWLGPALAETHRTLDLLAEQGIQYVGDWVNDDQPYPLRTDHGPVVAMPYSIEVNDIGIFMRRGFTGPDYAQLLRDQCEVLLREGAESARVMCIALHPFIVGVPFRAKYLEQALAWMRQQEGVWFTTGAEILAAYRAATAPPGPA